MIILLLLCSNTDVFIRCRMMCQGQLQKSSIYIVNLRPLDIHHAYLQSLPKSWARWPIFLIKSDLISFDYEYIENNEIRIVTSIHVGSVLCTSCFLVTSSVKVTWYRNVVCSQQFFFAKYCEVVSSFNGCKLMFYLWEC